LHTQFGGDGALGLMRASWLVNVIYFFSNDALSSIVCGITAVKNA
jgi:hypothetical protein